MSWREALDHLQESVTKNVNNVVRLREALEDYESTLKRSHEELDFLQYVDLQLVQYVFDVHEVMARIAEGLQKLTEANFCDLLLPEGRDKLKVAWATDQSLVGLEVPIKDTVTGEAYRNGIALLVPDLSKDGRYWEAITPPKEVSSIPMRSELAVPMKDQFGDVFGVINLESTEVEHFTDHHRMLAQTLAGQAAIALRNARLYEQFTSILETFSVLKTEEESLQTILSAVGQKAQEMVGAEHCQVLTLFGDELVVMYTTGQEEPGITRVKVEDSVSGLVVKRKEVIRYDDVSLNQEARQYYTDVLGGMRSEIAVPIIWKDEVLGVINLESPRPAGFGVHHEKLLNLFATQAAIAISNARRIQELSWDRQIQNELWAMAQIGDVYGPFIHRLNSDAGNISALLSEIRFKYSELLAGDVEFEHLIRGIEKKAERILEVPSKLKRQLEQVRSYKDLNANELIEKVLSRADTHHRPDVTFRKELQPIRSVWTSPQVEDVVENLIRNAVEAVPAGGIVVVGTRKWETQTQAEKTIESGIEIFVKDTCGGIPMDKLAGLWDFGSTSKDTTRQKHLGFGLWWVKGLVERLGGAITVDPQITIDGKKGCQFTVGLPFSSRDVRGIDMALKTHFGE